MSQSNVDTIRAGYEAFGRQDIPAVMAAFDPGIEWTSPDSLPNGGTFHGPEDVGGFFASLGDTWAELNVEPGEYLDAGDDVIVIGRHRVAGHNGVRADLDFVHRWTLRDGKIVRFYEVADTARMLPALEGAAAAG